MPHLPTCQTRVEKFGLLTVHYSEPDRNCQDQSHHDSYTEESA